MTQQIFVAIATYGPESDVDPLVALGTTEELANAALQRLIDDSDTPDEWIQTDRTVEHGVAAPEPSPPAWRQRTEDEQETLAIAKIEEVRDCAKDIAHEYLDAMDAEEVEDMLRVCNGDDDDD